MNQLLPYLIVNSFLTSAHEPSASRTPFDASTAYIQTITTQWLLSQKQQVSGVSLARYYDSADSILARINQLCPCVGAYTWFFQPTSCGTVAVSQWRHLPVCCLHARASPCGSRWAPIESSTSLGSHLRIRSARWNPIFEQTSPLNASGVRYSWVWELEREGERQNAATYKPNLETVRPHIGGPLFFPYMTSYRKH